MKAKFLFWSLFLSVCSFGQTGFLDTIEINALKFIQISKENNLFYSLTSIAGDTVIKAEDYYFQIEFVDIDEDGYNDIRVFIFSNTPNQCNNYLFDKKTQTFRQIEDCELDIKKIKGTDFYFSYIRGGCADNNWNSYLSKIENFKLITYASISGVGCKGRENAISIYTRKDDKETLIDKLPYKKTISRYGDKWSFIENYWKQNCYRF